MTEWAIEADAELPWLGGFALAPGALAGGWRLDFVEDAVLARVAGFEIRWRPLGSASDAPVTVRAFEAGAGSAT
jgi:hypothetical protein